MRLIIVSGRSGSGKSTALNVLEDIGFTCIDNLPAILLPNLVQQIIHQDDKKYAVSIDARNPESDLEALPNLVKLPVISTLEYQIIFLDASDDILLKRFSETRRRHPLSDAKTDLQAAITQEKTLLKPIIDEADITIDTSEMGFHDLRDFIKRRIIATQTNGLTILFQSFGFKHGTPREADLIFDVRCLPNPHWKAELRALTGNDKPVADFLAKQPHVCEMQDDIVQFLEHWLPRYESNNRSYMTIAIGCTGGQHRSVYLCNQLTAHFQHIQHNIQCRHRELTP